MSSNWFKKYGLPALCLLVFSLISPASGFALSGPKLKLDVPTPDTLETPGDSIVLFISVQNVGDEPTTAEPIVISDTTGPGLEVAELQGPPKTSNEFYAPRVKTTCEAVGATLKCFYPGVLEPGVQITMEIAIKSIPSAAGTLVNTASASGGGTVGTTKLEHQIEVGPMRPFGFDLAAATLLDSDGQPSFQAASDPAEFTTSLQWSSFGSTAEEYVPLLVPTGHFKDVIAHLPPGLIGNPSATPALCTADELTEEVPGSNIVPNCPLDSQIGIAHVDLGGTSLFTPLYNMVAPYGVATELGFDIASTSVLLDAYVRPGDHGIDIVSRDTTTSVPVTGVDITVWGVPADPSHDRYRGMCTNSDYEGPNGLVCPAGTARKAFLRLPTSCSGSPLQFGIESNTYEKEDVWASKSFTSPALSGCDLVPFSPSISVSPTGTASDSPTGVSVKLSLPQNQDPDGLAEADLKKAVVTLPEGMAINPSAADGLQACDDAQLHLDSNVPAECPDGSKIGTVLLHTQLISNPIEGSIYVRTQNSSDPASGEMFRIAIELRDDSHGIDIKLAGQISANPVTGRLTTTFDDNPQLPFEDVSLNFKAGARAPLVTPASCQAQTTEASLYSWAQPDVAVHRSSSFALTSGPGGSACPPPVPFAPSFSAGVGNVEAGNYTPFLTTFSRSDADQSMQRVSVTMPKGLSGSLAGLPLCPEAQANAGTCTEASRIGDVTAGAGAGPTPFYVTGGKVFMTGSYEGAPFGLSVVVPAKAGPFDLGTVVVRARVEVNPHTTQLTVVTDPLPQVVGGVPVDLRLVNVTIDRPDFTFNPTDCEHSSVTGTMTGGQGAVATLSKGFQVTNCGALRFRPKFSVSTSGKTSRRNGASLDAKLAYPKAPFGSQANIAKVKVVLPKQLPSRLTTLQKACPAATFDANPAACPVASRIGTATATTPILPVSLSGPAYFVSHGGEAFPDLIVVLQGYGVTVDLVGTTFINEKTNVTSTTFKQVPDVPVGTFEIKLPQGPDSALAAPKSLCASKLAMPTAFIAQDGAEVHQDTPIAITRCTKHKAKKAKRSHKHRANTGSRRDRRVARGR